MHYTVHGVLQASMEWVAFLFSRGSSQARSPTLQTNSLPAEPQGKPKNTGVGSLSLLQQILPTQGLNRGLLHYSWFFTNWAIREAPSLWIVVMLLQINLPSPCSLDVSLPVPHQSASRAVHLVSWTSPPHSSPHNPTWSNYVPGIYTNYSWSLDNAGGFGAQPQHSWKPRYYYFCLRYERIGKWHMKSRNLK